MLLQGMYAHPHVVINTRRPLLPRVPHQGRCTAMGASLNMDGAGRNSPEAVSHAALHADNQHMCVTDSSHACRADRQLCGTSLQHVKVEGVVAGRWRIQCRSHLRCGNKTHMSHFRLATHTLGTCLQKQWLLSQAHVDGCVAQTQSETLYLVSLQQL